MAGQLKMVKQVYLRALAVGVTVISMLIAGSAGCASAGRQQAIDNLLAGNFKWKVSPPLVSPLARPDPAYSVKDPSVVYYNGRWHLFCTIRGQKRSHQIEYISFDDWSNVANAERQMLKITDGYYCAPQVFYFRPHKKWYLVYQSVDKSREKGFGPAFSTTENISDVDSWTKPAFLFDKWPENVERWIDFWVICDNTRAHLFFTSLDGRMWRSETKLADFPRRWGWPKVVLEADIFEAGHTYRLKGMDKFITVIEAEEKGKRYYKAYIAEALDGKWSTLADSKARPFAGPANCTDTAEHWTDSFSHGELLRAGCDQHLEVDPADIRLLFQGVTDRARESSKNYGHIPWRLGILEPDQ